jgi:hypothetical protein
LHHSVRFNRSYRVPAHEALQLAKGSQDSRNRQRSTVAYTHLPHLIGVVKFNITLSSSLTARGLTFNQKRIAAAQGCSSRSTMIRHPTGIGLLTALWLLAALSRTTYAAASPSTATHSWHFQRDTPSSAKITSPTTSATITSSTASPSNSTASTSNSNSTSPALALATALLSLSPSNCTDSGGGCAVLS